MGYKVELDEFAGPLDLLLHLIKDANIDIVDIKIEEITNQYLNYIKQMEQMNLNIASEYLVMAAELIEMKSNVLLPKPIGEVDDYEEDPRESLIKRLLDYQHYKEITPKLQELADERKEYYTKYPTNINEYQSDEKMNLDISLTDLLEAFEKFLEKRELSKPLNTKIAIKEYSVTERSNQIKNILKKKKKIEFTELFDIMTKEYIVVSFLSILELAKKQALTITQDKNFNKIYLTAKGCE